MRRLIAVLLIVVGCARAAEAVSVRDLIELSRAGLGDEVLLALIEVHRGVYAIDAATLKSLKEAGVSDTVIAALIRSGREQPPPPEPSWQPAEPAWTGEPVAHTQPPVVVIEHHAAPAIQHVHVPVPVYVTVPTVKPRHRAVSQVPVQSTFVPFQTGPPPSQPTTPVRSGPPVYWGFGGNLRPDAWQPAGHRPDGRKTDAGEGAGARRPRTD